MSASNEKQPKQPPVVNKVAAGPDLTLLYEQALARIAELEGENARLKARVTELEGSAGGMSGYLITTPNPNYSGVTAKVQFRRGRAFIPDGPGTTELATEIEREFGYRVEHVDDWRELPQAPAMARSFIDTVLGKPAGE